MINNDKGTTGIINVIAECFYCKPTEALKYKVSNIDMSLLHCDIEDDVHSKMSEVKRLAEDVSVVDLKDDFNALFERSKNRLAYPWGSIYLTRNNRLFDQSTLAFMDFCKKSHLHFKLEQNEPIDHFSLMLSALVLCLEQDLQEQKGTVKELLQQHLLSWSDRFLALVSEHCQSGFYAAVADLCQCLLTDLAYRYHINIEPAVLYK